MDELKFFCGLAGWVYFVAVRVLAPRSDFGEYLGTFGGMAAVVFGSATIVAIAWVIFDRLGFPLAKRSRDSEPE